MRTKYTLILGLLGLLGLPSAQAAEVLTPKGETVPSLVRSTEAGGNYVNLPPGQRLEFAVSGPRSLEIYIRQRLPSAAAPVGAARVSVLVDGAAVATTRVEAPLEAGATVTDIPVAAVNLPSQLPVAVPAGDHLVSITSEANNPPLLVQVVVSSAWDSTPAPAAPAELDLTALLADEDEAPGTPPPGASAATAPAPAATVATAPATPTPPVDPADADATSGNRALSDLQAGVRLGAGAANAGTSPSVYLGLEARLPLGEHLRLTGAFGRYNIRLEQDLAIQPSLGGAEAQVTETIDWRTRVRPLELGAQVVAPVGDSAQLWAGAALATYVSTRIQDDEVRRGLSLGRAWGVGLDLPVKDFTLSPSFSVNAGRRGFDNPTVDGGTAREQLRAARVNVALFYSF